MNHPLKKKAYDKARNASPEAKARRASPEWKAYRKAWNALPKTKAYSKAWRASPEAKARLRARRASPYGKASKKAWGVSPGGRASHSAQRAKRRRSLSGGRYDLTAAQWLKILEFHSYRCAWCERGSQKLTQDHLYPISKGGEHTKDNVVPACTPCNSSKGNRVWFP